MVSVSQPAQVDQGLLDACGAEPGRLCQWVWDSTSNETLAKMVDWFVGTPVTVLLILLGAWILSHFTRRHLGRLISAAVAKHDSVATRQLDRVGLGRLVDDPDPRRDARARSIAGVVGGTVAVIIWVIAIITVLGEVGIDLGPLIAGAGIAGVALGF